VIESPDTIISFFQLYFSYNKAYFGGALYSDLRGSIILRNLVFENNQATA
jgi:predicted outer membrane repeat protein